MKKILSVLAVTFVVGHAAFANIQPQDVTDSRSFIAALELKRDIQRYIRGRAPATPQLLVEIVAFLDAVDTRQIGLQPKVTEMLALAEEVARQFKKLEPETKARLRPIMDSLLTKYSKQSRKLSVIRLFDRFWLWSPDNLDFMANQIRNDNSYLISTQVMWILERASQEQRRSFFAQIPEKKPNRAVRWFSSALAYKYGYPIDLSEFRRSLNLVNPEFFKPQARPIVLDGVSLPTTADLYRETKLRLQNEPPAKECSRYLRFASLVKGPN